MLSILKKKKIFLYILLVLCVLSFIIGGFIFIPKYIANKSLAAYMSEYREEAEIRNNEKKKDCNRENERDLLLEEEGLSYREYFNKVIQSFEDESECYNQYLREEHTWYEDKIIALEAIDTSKTPYEEKTKKIVQSLNRQKDYVEDLNNYNYDYYEVYKGYHYCKKSVFSQQITVDDSDFLEGYDETTLDNAITACDNSFVDADKELDERYEELTSKSEDLTKVTDTSRELTKEINEFYLK
jgi:hypothetical protein